MDDRRTLRGVLVVVFIVVSLITIALAGNQAFAYDRQSAASYGEYFYDKVPSDGHYWVAQFVSGTQKSSAVRNYAPGTSVGVVQNDLNNKKPEDWRGVDCAHFVSCCVGSPSTYAGQSGGGLNVPSRGGAYGEPGADNLVDWLLGKGKYSSTNHPGMEVHSLSDMEPGDVIAYDWSEDGYGKINHVALYSGNGEVVASRKEDFTRRQR